MSQRLYLDEETKNESTPILQTSTVGLFSSCTPLNKKTIYFITNPSEDQSHGSSLYFVSPHGTIRCRCDRARKDHTSPAIMIRPNMIGYFKSSKKIQTLEAKVGFRPYEVPALNSKSMDPLLLLNLKINTTVRTTKHHKGHPITEIVSAEQINNPTFKPKTWVDCEDVGILWSSAVDELKKAEMRAVINKDGRFVTDTIFIPMHEKKSRCAIS